jgi:hypothetical protein
MVLPGGDGTDSPGVAEPVSNGKLIDSHRAR